MKNQLPGGFAHPKQWVMGQRNTDSMYPSILNTDLKVAIPLRHLFLLRFWEHKIAVIRVIWVRNWFWDALIMVSGYGGSITIIGFTETFFWIEEYTFH